MKAIFGALLTIVIGLALLPVVNTFVENASVNQTATTTTLLALVPIFWVLAVVAIAAALAYKSFAK